MFNLKSKLVGAALGCAMVCTTANAAFMSYYIDPDGAAGAGQAVLVNEFMDINTGFLGQNQNLVGTSFNFNQYGVANVSGVNGGNLFDINTTYGAATFNAFGGASATYTGSGTGSFATNTFAFNNGTINLYNPLGGLFASFNVVGGGGGLNTIGGVPNGNATLVGQATFFAPGYLFISNGGVIGADFATLTPAQLLNTFGFSTTNASLITDPTQLTILDGKLSAAYPGVPFVQNANGVNDLTGLGGNPSQFYVSANGQFRLNQVPEPTSIALFGLGLLGLAASRRRAVK